MIDHNEFFLKDVSLRDYQQQAKEEIFRQWNVVDNILYQMPTGTGKTRLFTSLIRDINNWGLIHGRMFRILIIAHRSELIEQSSKSLNKYNIRHGVLAGNLKEYRNLQQPIQIASIQSITHSSNLYLLQKNKFDFIIIDEAHHSVANSYIKLWKYYPEAKKLGVTATPWRMNKSGFTKNFQSFISSKPIKYFIEKGWLSSYQYYSIPTNSSIQKSIDSIKDFDIQGDYKSGALLDLIDTSHIRAQLYNSYKNLAFGKKGIIYSISREHSEHICEKYRKHGVKIENIDSKTPAKEREHIIAEFKNGNIDIIVNVDIFSEGFDCPNIEFIQLARPTKSLTKYIQQVGRGLRKNGDKICIILDNVGMYSRFGLPDEDRDWAFFFEGEDMRAVSTQKSSSNNLTCSCINKMDISEGNETMVLIQDNSIINITPTDVIAKNETFFIEDTMECLPEINTLNRYLIHSKTFYSKYQIEETEQGFYIKNIRNNKTMFLINSSSFPSGQIIIQKGSIKSSYAIIKSFNSTNMLTGNKIIGHIRKEGLLLKFSSFDKKIIDKSIII